MGPTTAGRGVESWILEARELLEARADPSNAVSMAAYMKDRFPFFGLKGPERKEVFRELLVRRGKPSAAELPELFRACFRQEEREFQYLVNDLGRRFLPRFPLSMLEVIEELIPVKSWWDTVDFLAPKLAGHLLLRFPDQLEPTAHRWIDSDNFWYQRSAILLQLDHKEATRPELLFDCILRRADSSEFFVQKAAGWALRQYSKVAPEGVAAFISRHDLPSLTVREGRKWLDRQ